MNYKLLFFLVEGDDDERFFQKIVRHELEEKYDSVRLWKHAQVKNMKVDNFIKSIKAMGAEYIYIVDINDAPCVTRKKQEILNKFKNINIDRLIIVIKEIESWYLAGLDNKRSKELKIPAFNTTNDVTKEKFNELVPKGFGSNIDFMIEMLKHFSIETAKEKNKSFRYFLEKHNCHV